MITEDYVSFETAKLLKEKGFDENCSALYDLRTGEISQQGVGYVFNNNQWDNHITAPTLQMTMKWLRNVHKCILSPMWDFTEKDEKDNVIIDSIRWSCEITILRPHNGRNFFLDMQGENSISPEEACEAAIKYCLENLI